jgi:hypothetical protein
MHDVIEHDAADHRQQQRNGEHGREVEQLASPMAK